MRRNRSPDRREPAAGTSLAIRWVEAQILEIVRRGVRYSNDTVGFGVPV
jgi:hypothetical protein